MLRQTARWTFHGVLWDLGHAVPTEFLPRLGFHGLRLTTHKTKCEHYASGNGDGKAEY
jgi:hypothetical protein